MPNLSEVVVKKLETGNALEDLNRIFLTTEQSSEEDFYRLSSRSTRPPTDYLSAYGNDFFGVAQTDFWENSQFLEKCSPSSNNLSPFSMESNNFTNVFQPIDTVHGVNHFENTIRSNECGIPRKKYPIRCRHCGFVLPTLYDRRRHEELSHGSFLLTCDSCNRKFHSKDVLIKHIYSKCAPSSSSV